MQIRRWNRREMEPLNYLITVLCNSNLCEIFTIKA